MPQRRNCFISGLLLLAALLSAFGLSAAEEHANWAYRAWQTDEGLPDNSVTGVAQTSDGYLWVATYGGLMRFDGASFAAVQLPGLLRKSVRTMLLDRHGRFWLGIDTGSVICLESNVSRTYGSGDGLPGDRIAAMAEDHLGAIWVIYPTALCRIKDGHVTRFAAAEGLPAGANAWVTSDAHGGLWFSKGGLVGVFDNGLLRTNLTFKETAVRICGAASSGLWICAGSSLLKYDGSNEPVECASLLTNAVPQVLFEDRAGALW